VAASSSAVFDVFVSYRRTTIEAAEALARALAKHELVVWLDVWKLIPGEPWKPAVERGLAASRACVVVVGPEGLGPWQQEESYVAVDRRVADPTFRVIPVLLPGASEPAAAELPAFLRAATWVRFERSLDEEDALHRLACGVRGVAPEQGPGRAVYEGERPYVGLVPFTADRRRFFFGREAKVARCVERLRAIHEGRTARRLLALVGPSGSGKSSIVQAGILPALQQGAVPGSESWPVAALRPGADPVEALAVALAGVQDVPLRALVEDLAAEPATLHRFALRALGSAEPARRLVVFVDQLEEAFTVARPDRAGRFLDALLHAVAEPRGPVVALVALSAGFYDRCLAREDLAEALTEGQEPVGRMTEDELRRAIERPAQLVGVEFAEGLADLLVQDAGTHPAALPLLQHVLQELWERRSGRTLRTEDYRALGRLAGALEKHAEGTFARFDAERQAACRRVFLRLTALGEGVEDTRRRAPLDEVVPAAEGPLAGVTRSVVEELDARHLVSLDADAQGRTVVEPHEALIRNWTRLRRWLDEDRPALRMHASLRDAARAWTAADRKDPSYLLSGARLSAARQWADAHPGDASAEEAAFLAASEAERRRAEAARVRQRGATWIAAATVALLVAYAGLSALWTNAARAGERRARWLGLVNASRGTESDLGLSLFLAREATRFTDLPGEPAVSQLHAALRGTPWSREVASSALLIPQPGEDAFLVRGHGTLRAVDFEGNVLAEMPDRDYPRNPARTFRRATSAILVHCPGRCDLVAGREAVALPLAGDEEVALSRDGRTVVGVRSGAAPEVFRLDWRSGRIERRAVDPTRMKDPTVSPSGDCILSVADGRAYVWDAAGEVVAERALPPVRGEVRVLFASGAPRVLVGHFSRDATGAGFAWTFWDWRSGEARTWRDANPELLVWPTPDGLWARRSDRRGEGFLAQIAPSGEWAAFGVWPQTNVPAERWRRRGWLSGDTGVHVERFRAEPRTTVAIGERALGVALEAGGPGTLVVTTPGATVRRFGLDGRSTGVHHVPVHDGVSHTIAFDAAGRRAVLRDPNGRVVLVPLLDDELPRYEVAQAVHRATFGPDGDLVVTAHQGDDACALWDRFGALRAVIGKGVHREEAHDARIAPSGRWVVACAGRAARVFGVDGTLRADLVGHEADVRSVAFGPRTGDRVVVTASEDGTFGLWDLDGRSLGRFPATPGRTGPLLSAALSPDETKVVTAGADGTARLWTIDGTPVGRPMAHDNAVRCAVFSPRGDRVLTTSLDRTAALWTLDGERVATLRGHLDEVTWGDVAPDGATVATASSDGTARLWTTEGTLVAVLRGHRGPVTSVAFSPRGDRLITASADETVRTWWARTPDVVAAADRRLRRSFADAELAPFRDVLPGP
jgi:WD40 repeat protein